MTHTSQEVTLGHTCRIRLGTELFRCFERLRQCSFSRFAVGYIDNDRYGVLDRVDPSLPSDLPTPRNRPVFASKYGVEIGDQPFFRFAVIDFSDTLVLISRET